MVSEENLADLFPGRKESLEKILRFNMWDVMQYRTNDWTHSLRVRWIADELAPIAGDLVPEFDAARAACLALVHDDAEILTGDVQAGRKAIMSAAQLGEVKERDRQAALRLGEEHQLMVDGKYPYGDLLMEAHEKSTPVAQLVSYADKMDAYCESFHELYSGNFSFMRSVIFYTDLFARAEAKFPELAPMLGDPRSPFTDLKAYLKEDFVNAAAYARFGHPFTPESLEWPTQFPFYDHWRDLVLARGGEEGRAMLLVHKETI